MLNDFCISANKLRVENVILRPKDMNNTNTKNMKHILLKLVMAAVLLFLTACTSSEAPNGVEIPEYTPDEDIVVKKGYTASYNHKTLVPNWVAWELTMDEFVPVRHFQAKFKADRYVYSPKANVQDYQNNGWDKGHMAPVRDMCWDETAYNEAFLLTNACPQDHGLNTGAWRKIEELTRHMAAYYDTVYVVCGPIFSNDVRKIGRHGVCVPDAFFKAIAIKSDSGYHTTAFLLENKTLNGASQSYAITVDSVESVIGRNLFPTINEEYEKVLCLDEMIDGLNRCI